MEEKLEMEHKDLVAEREISGKVVPDDRISLQAQTPHASRKFDGHAAIFDSFSLFFLAYERVSAVEHVGEATSEQHVNK